MSPLEDAVSALYIMELDTGHSYMQTHNGSLAVSFCYMLSYDKAFTVRDCAKKDLLGL